MERERRLFCGACEPVRLSKSARRRVRGADLPASQTDFPGSRAVRRSTGGETPCFMAGVSGTAARQSGAMRIGFTGNPARRICSGQTASRGVLGTVSGLDRRYAALRTLRRSARRPPQRIPARRKESYGVRRPGGTLYRRRREKCPGRAACMRRGAEFAGCSCSASAVSSARMGRRGGERFCLGERPLRSVSFCATLLGLRN